MRRLSWLLGVAMVVALAVVAGACAGDGGEPTPTTIPSIPKTVTAALVPSETSVEVGKVFTMSIVLNNPKGQTVHGTDTFVDFDRDYFEVVGPNGQPASEITPGTMLPVLLFNGANNGEGVITYSAGILSNERNEVSITVATIGFRAKKATAATKIKFSAAYARKTEVVYGSSPVLAGVEEATVAIR